MPNLIIPAPPAFNNDPCFPQRIEEFSVQQLVPKLAVEVLVKCVQHVLILERAGEGCGEERSLLAVVLPDRRFDIAASPPCVKCR